MVARRSTGKSKQVPGAPAKPSGRPAVVSVAKITSKGQITIPKAVRETFNFKPGDEIVFVEDETGTHVRRRFDESRLRKWQGYFKDLKGKDPDDLVADWRGH